MTDDYKKNILAYLCGKTEKQTGSNIPQFTNTKVEVNDLYTNIANVVGEYFSTIGETIIRAVGYEQAYKSNLTIFYGYSQNNRHPNMYGWLALVDDNSNLIQIIDTYSSGVVIGRIDDLGIAEDGSIYLIERRYDNSNILRIVTLNNIAIKSPTSENYIAKIKKTYQIANRSVAGDNYFYQIIKKHPTKNSFCCGGYNYNGDEPVNTVLELVDQGTGEPQLTHFNATININIKDLWNSWDNEDYLYFKMTGLDYSNYNETYILTRSADTISSTNINVPFITNEGFIPSANMKILDSNNIYYCGFEISETENKRVYVIYKLNGNIYENIYSQDEDYKEYDRNEATYSNLIINDGELYYNASIYVANISNYKVQYGRIVDKKVYLNEVYFSTSNLIYAINSLIIVKTFNLYKYIFQSKDTSVSSLQIYNLNNYNGLEYSDINSMVPNQGILYDSQNEPIFARNLYNKTITGRTTQSTIEVPNNYLNDKIIAKENLLSETNSILISNNQTITKNIYETLNINFINTVQIKNDNEMTNPMLNPIGASRLNNSISETTDYDNTKALKVKINFADNTNYIIQLKENQVDKINDTSYMYDFDIYVSKDITNIQIISNDETTIYQTITSTFEVGKFYNITQMVEIV
jgi:hypothetical protein